MTSNVLPGSSHPKSIFGWVAFIAMQLSGALAAPGDLDITFGPGGVVTTDVTTTPDFGRAIALQADGKILVAGYSGNGGSIDDFSLVRYLPDGTLDAAFGTGGNVVTDINDGSLDRAWGLAVQSDGRILVAGKCTKNSADDFAIVRYQTNGVLDTTFGTGGKVITDLAAGSSDYAYCVVMQTDGRILVAGVTEGAGRLNDSALVRYEANGALDTTFGNGGKVITSVGTLHDYFEGVALQSDGKIVAVGGVMSGEYGFSLVRYLADGSLDASFGSGGKAIAPVGAAGDYGRKLAIQKDGKILVVGDTFNGTKYDFALARFESNGSLDAGFGDGGKVTAAFGTYDSGRAVAVQGDGKIVIAGGARINSRYHFAMACYEPNGTVDSSFGQGGKVMAPVGTGDSEVYGMAVQPDGKILLAGEGYTTAGRVFALARYQGTTQPEMEVRFPPWGKILTNGATADFGDMVSTNVWASELRKSIGVLNRGAATLTVQALRIDGANAQDFQLYAPASISVVPDGLTGFEVGFWPKGFGPRTATLHVYSDDAEQNPFDVVLTGNGVPPFGITTGNPLPCGTVGVPYALNLAYVGGVQPYEWTLYDNRGLPEGLTLTNELISGTPTAVTTNSYFTIRVENEGQNYPVYRSFNLRILAASDLGALDGSFGSGGKVVTSMGADIGRVTGLALQSDGKILIAASAGNGSDSDFALRRYQADGTPDSTFGNQGVVITAVGPGHDFAKSVVVQSDGKIVAVGRASNENDNDFAVVRYQANGALDTGFGTGGKVTTGIGANSTDEARSVALQSDGKIVVAGSSDNGNVTEDIALARYLTNGSPDTTFGFGGKVLTPLSSADDGAASVAVLGDGTILVAGFQGSDDGNDELALLRYRADGTLDPAFGSGGKVLTPLTPYADHGASVAVQGDGRIVVAGYSGNEDGRNDFAVARYLLDGTLDTAFGNGGQVITDFGGSDDFGHSVAVLPDGKILVAGASRNSGSYDFALVLYRSGGTLETSFGNSGRMLTPVTPGSDDVAWNVVVQKDGNFLVAGDSRNGNNYDVALVRYIGSTTYAARAPQIVTASPLPSGMVGVPYSFNLAASGGVAPYTWSLVSGDLPSGVVFSGTGLIEGTPASGVSGNFTVRVAGSDGLAATNTFALPILPTLKPGDLDPSFGIGGKVITAFGERDDYGYSAVVQADGKIVLAGYAFINNTEDFALARYLPDGSLDPSFGDGGKVTTDLGLSREQARSVALQWDGKILVAGDCFQSGSSKFTLLRYQPDGTLDSSFGTGGRITNFVGNTSYGKTVMLQSDGRIVMAGEVNAAGVDFGAARWLADGSPDPTFGSGGVATANLGASASFDYPQGAALQADDKILVVGYTAGAVNSDFGVVRFLANGGVDTSFGTGGIIITPFANTGDYARGVVVQTDGRIVVTGETGRDFGLARYLPDGSLDASFGSGGKATTAIDRFEAFPRSIALQSGGKIVVAGYTSNGRDNDFAVARYNPDGTLDASFGTGGKLMTDFGIGHDRARSVVLQADGKIVVAGETWNGTNYDFALVRYFGSLDPEITVEQSPGTVLADGSAHVAFGAIEPGATPVVRTFTVKNRGGAVLSGLSVTKDGANAADFAVGSLGTTSLAPGASLTLDISFSPAALGSRSATLHIASNDADENPFDITLSGIGGSLSPLQAWRLAHFGTPGDTGAGANGNDFDQDGYANLLEYASGSDPKVPDAANVRPAASAVDDKFLYTFTCDARCTDITYTVQATGALVTAPWIDIAKSEGGHAVSSEFMFPWGPLCEVTDTGTGLRRVTIAIRNASFGNLTGFLRVKVSE